MSGMIEMPELNRHDEGWLGITGMTKDDRGH